MKYVSFFKELKELIRPAATNDALYSVKWSNHYKNYYKFTLAARNRYSPTQLAPSAFTRNPRGHTHWKLPSVFWQIPPEHKDGFSKHSSTSWQREEHTIGVRPRVTAHDSHLSPNSVSAYPFSFILSSIWSLFYFIVRNGLNSSPRPNVLRVNNVHGPRTQVTETHPGRWFGRRSGRTRRHSGTCSPRLCYNKPPDHKYKGWSGTRPPLRHERERER